MAAGASPKRYTPTPNQLKNAKKACTACGRLTVKIERRTCKSCGSARFDAFSRQPSQVPPVRTPRAVSPALPLASTAVSGAGSGSKLTVQTTPICASTGSNVAVPTSHGSQIAAISEDMKRFSISPVVVEVEVMLPHVQPQPVPSEEPRTAEEPPSVVRSHQAFTRSPRLSGDGGTKNGGTRSGGGGGGGGGAFSSFSALALPTHFPLPAGDEETRTQLSHVVVSPTASASTRKACGGGGSGGGGAGAGVKPPSPRQDELFPGEWWDPVQDGTPLRLPAATPASADSCSGGSTSTSGSRSSCGARSRLTIDSSLGFNSPLLDLSESFPTPIALSSFLRFTGVLGKGAYSTVFKGEMVDASRRRVAIKCIDKGRSEGKRLKLEIESLQQSTRHPNIVELLRVENTPDTLYIITELVEGGELFDRICDLGSFSEKDAAGILRQILDALVFLHAKGIVHRDIKPGAYVA
jgi:hypothetical protein